MGAGGGGGGASEAVAVWSAGGGGAASGTAGAGGGGGPSDASAARSGSFGACLHGARRAVLAVVREIQVRMHELGHVPPDEGVDGARRLLFLRATVPSRTHGSLWRAFERTSEASDADPRMIKHADVVDLALVT